MTPHRGPAPAERSVVIHAHFYQPPREEPWLEEVEHEPTAAPFHDWNERIEKECYRAVVAARIPAADGRIGRLVNTLEHISFNVGPTLASWLETEAPETWRAMLAADQASRRRLRGHGNALAMPYHHIILPLATRRDKTTEVRWGITDFRRRFGREPEGMWLPETAVDDETLDVLAAEGIRFTVLAPHQVAAPPPRGLPGRYTTRAGREITLCIYDGGLSHDVAFGPLVRDGAAWAKRMLAGHQEGHDPMLVSLAADGETFGHHHRFGEMALAAALERMGRSRHAHVENFASFLARHPAAHDVQLVERTSWSCAHGVERWRSDCGCRTEQGTNQAWRAPLRHALDWLAGELHRRFEREARSYVDDPWAARDGYFGEQPASRPVRLAELLELERNALRMFTSCGWFFNDVGGIETVIDLRYAARAIELAGADGDELEEGLRARLAAAESNDPAVDSGREVYDRKARPRFPGHVRAAAGFAAVQELAPLSRRERIGAYRVEPATNGAVTMTHVPTGRAWAARAAVLQPTHGMLAVDVTITEDGRTYHVGHEDLPEREAEQVRRVLRRAFRAGILTDDDERLILDAGVSYERVITEALVRQLPVDPTTDNNGIDLERLDRTLDLLAVEGHHVPYDAQTRYYRLMTEGRPALRAALAPLAERFGFASTAFQETG